VKLSTEDVNKDGLMLTAVLVDYVDDKTEFPAYVSLSGLEGGIPVEAVDYYEIGGEHEDGKLAQPLQYPTLAKIVSYGWTDLNNPGCGYDASEYVYQKDGLEAGRYYDYTFYMLPTVYTVAPGHHLALVLTSWDPYRAFLDEDYQLDPDRDPSYSFFTYAFTVDNTSLGARIPVK
jgi:X-Pro dipeptidyl-peptidase